MSEAGAREKPGKSRFLKRFEKVGAGILAAGIATSGMGADSANSQEAPPHIQDAGSQTVKEPQLKTPKGAVIKIPGLAADGLFNSNNDSPKNSEVMDWLTRDNKAISYHDAPTPEHNLGFNRRDCDEVRADIAACTSDFGYGENAQGIFKSTFGVLDEKAGDGWDVMKVGGEFVSIIYTKDHTGIQVFLGENCKIGDGWILFPTNFIQDLKDGKKGNATVPIKQVYLKDDGTFECPPNDKYDKTYTEWEYDEDFKYSDGLERPTIIVKHYHSVDPATSGWEEFHFTKEQGLTGWKHVTQDHEVVDSHEWIHKQSPPLNASWPIPDLKTE